MDLWDHDWKNLDHNQTYGTVLDTIWEKIKLYNASSCVFANSFVRLDMQTKDVVNYLIKFYQNAPNTASKIQALDDLISAAGTEPLHHKLQPLLNSRDNCIYIPTTSAFKQWTETTGISHWIIVGAHWGVCTHDKPLGFNNLKNIKGIQLYSIPSCTLKWVSSKETTVASLDLLDYRRDNLKWHQVESDLYKLI